MGFPLPTTVTGQTRTAAVLLATASANPQENPTTLSKTMMILIMKRVLRLMKGVQLRIREEDWEMPGRMKLQMMQKCSS